MSFAIVMSFEGSCRTREYQWAANPSDDQIKEIVDELKLFRYTMPAVFIIKSLRDTDTKEMSSGKLTIKKI